MDFISGDTMHSTTLTSISPSFTTHSSNNLADVAARVVEEFRHQNGDAYDDILNLNIYDDYEFSPSPTDEKGNSSIPPLKTKDQNDSNEHDCSNHDDENDEDDDNDDDEFEFAVVCSDVNSCSISADEMFSQGHILPQIQYPLFDRSLLLESDVDPNINVVNRTAETAETAEADCKPSSLAVRLPLRKLFSEERDFGSSSSSEADDLDGITFGTYCVWNPKPLPQPEPSETCKKSNSTGNSSRRWKFRHLRDILYRSNSDREETPILSVKPSIANQKKLNSEKVNTIEKTGKVAATVGDGASPEQDPTNTVRRQSYLPSTHDLFAAFTSENRFNRNLHLL